MTKVNFEDTTEQDIRRQTLRKPYRSKRVRNKPSSSILPPDFPIHGTVEEKVDFWRNFNPNKPKWLN